MHTLRVAVLRGGPSADYDESLKTGQSILKHMPAHYHVRDILIDKEGVWHEHGVPRDPHDILKLTDVAIVAMHGKYGEDGKIQHILETFGVPFTGSGKLAAATSANKHLTKKILKNHGIKTPYHELAEIPGSIEHQAAEIFRKFPLPAVVKPVNESAGRGVSVVRSIKELEEGLRNAYQYADKVLIEEYIPGKVASCGVVDNFRGEKRYSLFPLEIVNERVKEVRHNSFTEDEKKKMQEVAKLVHDALGLRHYSHSDFIVHPRRGVYLLETHTLPPISPESPLAQALAAVGCSLPEFIEHIVQLAVKR